MLFEPRSLVGKQNCQSTEDESQKNSWTLKWGLETIDPRRERVGKTAKRGDQYEET